MGPLITTELFRGFLLGTLLATLGGVVAIWVWVFRRLLKEESLLPESPIVERREPPWGLGTIVLILVAYVLVSREAFVRYAPAAHADRAAQRVAAPPPAPVVKEAAKPGPAEKDATRQPDAQPPARPDDDDEEEESFPLGLSALELMAIQGAINGVFILLLPGLARLTSGTRLRDLGLCLRGWRRQAAVGIVAVLFLMPIVYGIQAACVKYLDMSASDWAKHRHPIEKMLGKDFSSGIAALAFVTAVVLAPVFEELLFRGFIQSWLIKILNRFGGWLRSWPPAVPPPVATLQTDALTLNLLADPDLDRFPIVAAAGTGVWEAADESPAPDREDDRAPVVPEGYGKVPGRPRLSSWTVAAIVLTSIIFAGLHAQQWPAPIPLFLLAMGLGVVYQRTGSLIAPICMHAVFNAVSTLGLFLAVLERPAREKPETRPVLERVVPGQNVKAAAPDVAPRPRPGKT